MFKTITTYFGHLEGLWVAVTDSWKPYDPLQGIRARSLSFLTSLHHLSTVLGSCKVLKYVLLDRTNIFTHMQLKVL